jgi:hypothetical protein
VLSGPAAIWRGREPLAKPGSEVTAPVVVIRSSLSLVPSADQ